MVDDEEDLTVCLHIENSIVSQITFTKDERIGYGVSDDKDIFSLIYLCELPDLIHVAFESNDIDEQNRLHNIIVSTNILCVEQYQDKINELLKEAELKLEVFIKKFKTIRIQYK